MRSMVAPRGRGSLRERRPGVWEIRVAAGTDPVTGRTLQRSVVFRGSAEEAEAYRRDLAAQYAERRGVARAAPWSLSATCSNGGCRLIIRGGRRRR